MRTALLAACLFGLSVSAAAEPAHAFPAHGAERGHLIATSGTEHACAWNVDGLSVGVSKQLEMPLAVGEHTLRCKRLVDGTSSTQVVSIVPSEKTEVVAKLPAVKGEIVGLSVGGVCSFAVNGATKGTSNELRLYVPAGTYRVSCTSASGAKKTRSIVVRSGEASMAMFEWR